MGWNDHVRIGTADRERAIAELGEHFVAGRLEVDEYEQRCGAAAAARTRGDLALLFDDLPAKPIQPAQPLQPATPPNPLIQSSGPRDTKVMFAGFGVLAVLGTVGVILFTGVWWALIPAALLGLMFFFLA